MSDTIKKSEEIENSDWDFDFSMYDQEESDEETIDSLKKLDRPRITGYRSRFSNGEAELEKQAQLSVWISKYSVIVAARTQDVPTLWKFYALLDEFWENIRNLSGSFINKEMNAIKKRCRLLIKKYENTKIPEEVHNNLLYFRSRIYQIKQYNNLGFEIEKVNKSIYNKAKRKITQG